MYMNNLNFGFALALLALPVAAQDTNQQVGVKNVELLQGWRTPTGSYMAAVRISLEKGWKTYWRAPGGNGIPPSFNWDGSRNMTSVEFHWPSPKVYVQFGIRTIGYKNDFILPIEIKPAADGEPVTLKTQIDFGVCNEVCVPVVSSIEAELGVDGVVNKTLIETALAARPRTAHESEVQSVSCKITPTKDGLNITTQIAFSNTAPSVRYSVIEYPGQDIWVEQVALENTGNSIVAQAELISFAEGTFEMNQNDLRLTLIGKDQSIEINGCATPS